MNGLVIHDLGLNRRDYRARRRRMLHRRHYLHQRQLKQEVANQLSGTGQIIGRSVYLVIFFLS